MSDITLSQVKAIHTGRRSVFSDEGEFREVLKKNYGVESVKALTSKQASNLIGFMKGDNKIIQQYRITAAQINRISLIVEKLGWDDKETTKFIKKQLGKLTSVQMLTKKEANSLIIGMSQVYCGNVGLDYNKFNNLSNKELIYV